jgi:hypothetical protein
MPETDLITLSVDILTCGLLYVVRVGRGEGQKEVFSSFDRKEAETYIERDLLGRKLPVGGIRRGKGL